MYVNYFMIIEGFKYYNKVFSENLVCIYVYKLKKNCNMRNGRESFYCIFLGIYKDFWCM